MTGTKIMSVNPAGQDQAVAQAAQNTRTKTDKSKDAFASLMSGSFANYANYGSTQQAMPQSAIKQQSFTVNRTDRNSIEPAKDSTLYDKLNASDTEPDSLSNEIIETTAEDLKVNTDDVEKALEELGMTAFDLLIPENLVQLASQLTGDTTSDLLVNDNFTGLMQDMNQIALDLMQSVGANPGELTELVAQMDILAEPEELNPEDAQVVLAAEDAAPAEELPEETTTKTDQLQPETSETEATAEEETQSQIQETNEALPEKESEDEAQAGAKDPREGTDTAQKTGEPIQAPVNEVQNMDIEAPAPEISSTPYLNMDTRDIIDQIVQNARTQISEGTTTMEMQLNPENLGRIYLQISARQGSINATLTAQNEAVRAALEAQIADLKENLNQAGVKVDAIEVTVASHEFERNLEQNAQGDRQQGEREEAQSTSRRRNLSIDSLDDLSGVMSEEEALVTQMMLDNGNSVDLTA